MEQLNFIQLRGRVGLSRIQTVGDRKVCHFTLATNTIFRDRDNQAAEETTWFSCTLWSGKKFSDLNAIKVGAPVEVKGRGRNNKYTTMEGTEKTTFEVLVTDIEILPADEPLRSQSNI